MIKISAMNYQQFMKYLNFFQWKVLKKVFGFILCLCMLEITCAQNFKGGLRVGMSMSQLSGDNLSGYNKLGIYTGGYIKLPFTSRWSMQFELNFVMKGSTNAVNLSVERPDLYYSNLFYIQTPVLVKFQIFKKLDLELGPILNVLCVGTEHDANGRISNRKKFTTLEFSALVGLTYIIKEHYGINVRYEHSIIPVRKADVNTYYIYKSHQYSDYFSVSFLYQF